MDETGRSLAGYGRVALVTTTGRRTGMPRPVALGFVDDAEVAGAILVAATDPDAAWVRNLEADPRVAVTIAERTFAGRAEPLDPAAHRIVVRELILKYGTPSEGLGRGPSYRLRPLTSLPASGTIG